MPKANIGDKQLTADSKPGQKVTGPKFEKKAVTGASDDNIFALRVGNANESDGLLSIFDGKKSKGNQGAVQNWRKTEMADTAVSLGWIDDQFSTRPVLFAALVLFLISIIGRVAEFYLEI